MALGSSKHHVANAYMSASRLARRRFQRDFGEIINALLHGHEVIGVSRKGRALSVSKTLAPCLPKPMELDHPAYGKAGLDQWCKYEAT